MFEGDGQSEGWWVVVAPLPVNKRRGSTLGCGDGCPGSGQSSPPRCLWGIPSGAGEQAGEMPPFSAKPAQHLLAPIQRVSQGAGGAGASVGAGMLMLVLTFPGHCHHSGWTCLRLLQLRRARHGGTCCQPSGAAHGNRMHGLAVHHLNAAARVPGTSLSSLPCARVAFSFVSP